MRSGPSPMHGSVRRMSTCSRTASRTMDLVAVHDGMIVGFCFGHRYLGQMSSMDGSMGCSSRLCDQLIEELDRPVYTALLAP